MASFETDDGHAATHHRPVRVPKGRLETYSAARELCEDLGWRVLEASDERLSLRCEHRNGFLGGTSTIDVWVEGPEGIPSSTTRVRSSSTGALLAKDRGNVAEFVKKFTMRVC